MKCPKCTELEAERDGWKNYMVSCPWCGEALSGRPISAQFAHLIEHGDAYRDNNQRLRDALQQIADSEAGISWQLSLSYIAKQALEKEG